MWNHHRELTDYQIRRMSNTPGMIHCYAQHIAAQWQQRSGATAQVYCNALVSLNRRPMQPIVDPNIDLANAELRLLGHNDWIVPLGEQPRKQGLGHLATSNPSPVRVINEEILAHYPDGAKKITRRSGASGRYTIAQWYADGALALEAEYKNDLLDGTQTKYRADGSRDMQLHYRAGRLHGLASSWNADGRIASQLQYENGLRIDDRVRSRR